MEKFTDEFLDRLEESGKRVYEFFQAEADSIGAGLPPENQIAAIELLFGYVKIAESASRNSVKVAHDIISEWYV